MDLFGNAVFMLSCGRVKTELFENADVTASGVYVSEHAHGSLGITRGHFACLFSSIEAEHRSLHVAAFSRGREHFRKCSSCGRGYFFIRIKKMRFRKYPDTCGRGLN